MRFKGAKSAQEGRRARGMGFWGAGHLEQGAEGRSFWYDDAGDQARGGGPENIQGECFAMMDSSEGGEERSIGARAGGRREQGPAAAPPVGEPGAMPGRTRASTRGP